MSSKRLGDRFAPDKRPVEHPRSLVQHVIPAAQFGMSATRLHVPEAPTELPHRDVLHAANNLNEYRYKGLTHQQRVFVDAYLASGFDATAATLEARYTYSADEAVKIGRRLLKKSYIARAIDLALDYYTEKSKFRFKRDRYLQELENIALSNPLDYIDVDEEGHPTFKMPQDYERDKAAALQTVKMRRTTTGRGDNRTVEDTVEFKTHDKTGAIKELLRLESLHSGTLVEEAEKAVGGGHRIVSFNIVTVPVGEFIPAPEPPNKIAGPAES